MRELARQCELTVVAQPCEPDMLSAPCSREIYQYIEMPATSYYGLRWQSGLYELLGKHEWDVVCLDINMRHIVRIVSFFRYFRLRKKWIWRGQIFGRSNSSFLNYLRSYMIRKTKVCLVYSEPIAKKVKSEWGGDAISFNNTEVAKSEFRNGNYGFNRKVLNVLFVGRCQARKKLDRIVGLCERKPEVYLRLVGPGMENIDIPYFLESEGRVSRFGKTSGRDLDVHFDWADLVINPGHLGLLAMNSARHGKGIVVDSSSSHAPEFWLAKEAEQPFIDFSNSDVVDEFIDYVFETPGVIEEWGKRLQSVAREKYTIEYMAKAHISAFDLV
ncbi:MAG: hypothetical protein ACQEXC_08905 [Pseudomonadota bacterium]